MNVLVVLRVTLEAGVQVASQHDADLNGAKGFGDACEFHVNLQNCGFELLRIESGEDVVQQVDDGERDAAAERRPEQAPGLFVATPERVQRLSRQLSANPIAAGATSLISMSRKVISV